MRACNGAVQGLVERYLATLFYQCSQIAAFLEGSPVLPLERTGVERKVAAPEVPRKCPARPTRRSYGILEAPPEPDSTAPDLSTSGMVDTGDGAYDAGSECAESRFFSAAELFGLIFPLQLVSPKMAHPSTNKRELSSVSPELSL
ncbi:unnamed protein product [Effrenium voratum]|nr:unnamed protein product [Effrenium voratum]